MKPLTPLILIILLAASCRQKEGQQSPKASEATRGSFAYDLDFLSQRDSGLVLLRNGTSHVVVSPRYQAKVFTSTATGKAGKSLGWINYKAFDGKEDSHMNAYGGENRFWLGPEGNAFSLFFKPGTDMVFENWKTPAAFDTEAWGVVSMDSSQVSMRKQMSLLNYHNITLNLLVERTVTILDGARIGAIWGVDMGEAACVGYKTTNRITNTGDFAWTKETGAPCIWILDMFPPSGETQIVIPYDEQGEGPDATTNYFGTIPADRMKVRGNMLFLKADGAFRGKVGIPPARASQYAGSYDASNQILTITRFDLQGDALYLNQEWNVEAPPFAGDAVNAYNDGPLEDGSQMGPFYEIESVSPAAFLAPGEHLEHVHSVFHFSGSEADLNRISEVILGVGVRDISGAFKNF